MMTTSKLWAVFGLLAGLLRGVSGAAEVGSQHSHPAEVLLNLMAKHEKGSGAKPQTRRAFVEVIDTCQNITTNIKKGQYAVLDSLTDPSVYDRFKRPNTSPIDHGSETGRLVTTSPDAVTIQFSLASVVSLNQFTQEIILSVYQVSFWDDPRLSFDTRSNAQCVLGAGIEGLTWISLEEQHSEGETKVIWTPDIYIENERESLNGHSLTYVFESGMVGRMQQKKIATSCAMNFGQYPFDTQSCKVAVSTFSQSNQEITLTAGIADFLSDEPASLWATDQLSSYTVGAFSMDSTLTTETVTDGAYDYITGTLTFVRDSADFWLKTFMPDFFLHIAITASFWIPASGAPARVSLIIIAALSFRIMMSDLYAALPPVAYAVWVVDFMAASQILAVISLIQFACVSYFAAKEAKRLSILNSLCQCSIQSKSFNFNEKVKIRKFIERAEEKHQQFMKVCATARSSTRSELNTKTTHEMKQSPSRSASVDQLPTGNSKVKAKAIDATPIMHIVNPVIDLNDAFAVVTVKAIFLKHAKGSQAIHLSQVRAVMREFGKYLTDGQADALVDMFRVANHSSLAAEPDVSFEDLFVFTLAVGRGELAPFSNLNMSLAELLEDKPSSVVDVAARILYPCLYLIKVAILFSIKGLY